jgi:predicted acyltransferase
MGTAQSQPARIISLDQFRGYTVLGMFFVNFIGHFEVIRTDYPIFKHHNTYCSYADTIMPQFFFAVGFAYRLTLLKRLQTVSPWAAYLRVLRRNLGLILLGFVIYHLDGSAKTWEDLQTLGIDGFLTTAFQRNLFQTLVHIGVTSIWVMPVIAARPWARILFACFSAGLHIALSYGFYYDWVINRPGIDGGPLGFLTWTIPMLVGSLAYDSMASNKSYSAAFRILGWGTMLMLLGYVLACVNRATPPNTTSLGDMKSCLVEPPFVPPSHPVNLWTMSQRAGSVSYLVFGAGFSAAIYALFVLACDVGRLQLGLFRTLGVNALAAYIIHELVDHAIKPYAPKDAPLWYALAAFGLFLAICYLFLRHLERNQLFLRL